jgi:hypothetical protein
MSEFRESLPARWVKRAVDFIVKKRGQRSDRGRDWRRKSCVVRESCDDETCWCCGTETDVGGMRGLPPVRYVQENAVWRCEFCPVFATVRCSGCGLMTCFRHAGFGPDRKHSSGITCSGVVNSG